jgi:zinc transport system ATP-binding protein
VTPVFSATDATVELAGEPVIKHVSWDVAAGDFLTILGSNGAGKSTLIRALLGLIPLAQGSTKIFGVPARSFRNWERISYVPQQLTSAGAVPVSVREVVASGQYTPGWRKSKPNRTQVRTSLESVGLWERHKDALTSLSGGQQRRVMLARALARESQVVVLDEPTAGVDTANRARLHDSLARLKQDGVTVVLVTHQLAEVADLTSQCLVLDGDTADSVVFAGPPPLPRTLTDPEGHHSHPEGSASPWEMPL